MTKTETRIGQNDADRCKCAEYHSGNHRLVTAGGGKYVECQGCRGYYTAAQVRNAIDGRTRQEMGQGGVMLDE